MRNSFAVYASQFLNRRTDDWDGDGDRNRDGNGNDEDEDGDGESRMFYSFATLEGGGEGEGGWSGWDRWNGEGEREGSGEELELELEGGSGWLTGQFQETLTEPLLPPQTQPQPMVNRIQGVVGTPLLLLLLLYTWSFSLPSLFLLIPLSILLVYRLSTLVREVFDYSSTDSRHSLPSPNSLDSPNSVDSDSISVIVHSRTRGTQTHRSSRNVDTDVINTMDTDTMDGVDMDMGMGTGIDTNEGDIDISVSMPRVQHEEGVPCRTNKTSDSRVVQSLLRVLESPVGQPTGNGNIKYVCYDNYNICPFGGFCVYGALVNQGWPTIPGTSDPCNIRLGG
ncbi:hypothetical protein GGU11DRAFT_878832 [Lentinula aff. detonsa]|nr:hypothetical protein GGU11DRAFT_878832 [Lentinula aff. detonsa]